ncbi:threonine/serine exporter family protein [Clostridiaceae bacterium HFYG-1003]|nr:threonine/serine exporter family protein [Clostridiaceae bacterium HFYG-1003]
MNNEQIIEYAADAGQIILEAGSETYRVEDTINRILTAFGIEQPQSFVTPTGIVISGKRSDGSSISVVRRITAINVDLEKISMVNDLSRLIQEQQMTPASFKDGLNAIMLRPQYPLWLTLLMVGSATFSFTMIFRGTVPEAACAFAAGIVVFILRRLARGLKLNPFLQNAAGGLTAVLLGSLFVALGLTQTLSLIVIGTIMLLVPGITITNAIRDTFQGDYLSGVTRAVEAFVTASGIAFGTALGFLIVGVM